MENKYFTPQREKWLRSIIEDESFGHHDAYEDFGLNGLSDKEAYREMLYFTFYALSEYLASRISFDNLIDCVRVLSIFPADYKGKSDGSIKSISFAESVSGQIQAWRSDYTEGKGIGIKGVMFVDTYTKEFRLGSNGTCKKRKMVVFSEKLHRRTDELLSRYKTSQNPTDEEVINLLDLFHEELKNSKMGKSRVDLTGVFLDLDYESDSWEDMNAEGIDPKEKIRQFFEEFVEEHKNDFE